MHRGRGSRVPLGQDGVRGARVLVDSPLDPRQRRLVNRGRKLEIGQGCAEVEPRAARHDRRSTRGDELVDLRVRERRELADGHLLVERADPDEPGVERRLVREDRQAAVDLQRVDGHHLGPEPRRRRLCDGALARGGRAEDRDHLGKAPMARAHVRVGRVLVGHVLRRDARATGLLPTRRA